MPRLNNVSTQNHFTKGFITEATGLNFPEDGVTDTNNCIFTRLGLVKRRLGIDFETSASYRTINRTNCAINYYVWKNVTGDGSINIVVTQVGSTLYFWDASTAAKTASLSANQISNTVSLTTFLPAGSSNTIADVECQFTSGYGFLFVTHPYLEPFYVSYSSSGGGTFTAAAIDIKIRDFKGINDGLTDTERPLTLSTEHSYNLKNQGWRGGLGLVSTTSVTVGTGSKGPFVVDIPYGSSGILVGDIVKISDYITSSGASMTGVVTAYSGTNLTVNVTTTTGSGTHNNWNISLSPDDIATWFTALNNYPNNVDVWWKYKNSSDTFSPSTTFNNIPPSIKPAPKGHYILSAFNEDRSAAAGLAGISVVSTNYIRPATCAFMAGRIFYSGVNYKGYNNKIYFSQVIQENDPRYFGKCYQDNDPTDSSLSDLLPTDGGVIVLQGADEILKLFPMQEGLVAFAKNGVWMIVGSQGLGFSAVDFTIIKLDSIASISHTSFADVNGVPIWWNLEGIYTLTVGDAKRIGHSGLTVQSLTTSTIQSFYDNIPGISKKFAKGYYNKSEFIVQWVYRSTAATTLTNTYEYDSILCLNTVTGAFYTWTISSGTPKVNGIFCVEGFGGLSATSSVIEPTFKYLTSYAVAGPTYRITFSEENNQNFLDWYAYDNTGVSYSSYFKTGYRIPGQAIRKFEGTYINIFSQTDEDSSYKVRAIWDHATSATTGRWTTAQTINIDNAQTITVQADGYSTKPNKLKLRGHGLAFQLYIINNGASPFYIIGWSVLETGNQWV